MVDPTVRAFEGEKWGSQLLATEKWDRARLTPSRAPRQLGVRESIWNYTSDANIKAVEWDVSPLEEGKGRFFALEALHAAFYPSRSFDRHVSAMAKLSKTDPEWLWESEHLEELDRFTPEQVVPSVLSWTISLPLKALTATDSAPIDEFLALCGMP